MSLHSCLGGSGRSSSGRRRSASGGRLPASARTRGRPCSATPLLPGRELGGASSRARLAGNSRRRCRTPCRCRRRPLCCALGPWPAACSHLTHGAPSAAPSGLPLGVCVAPGKPPPASPRRRGGSLASRARTSRRCSARAPSPRRRRRSAGAAWVPWAPCAPLALPPAPSTSTLDGSSAPASGRRALHVARPAYFFLQPPQSSMPAPRRLAATRAEPSRHVRSRRMRVRRGVTCASRRVRARWEDEETSTTIIVAVRPTLRA